MTATTDLILTTSPAAATAGLWKSFYGGAEIKDAAASPTTGQISIIKVLGCRWKAWIKALHWTQRQISPRICRSREATLNLNSASEDPHQYKTEDNSSPI